MYYIYMGMSVSLRVCPYRSMHYGMCVHIHGCDCEHVQLYIYISIYLSIYLYIYIYMHWHVCISVRCVVHFLFQTERCCGFSVSDLDVCFLF